MDQTEIIIFIVTFSVTLVLFLGAIFMFIFQFRRKKIEHENEKKILSLNSIIQGQELERGRMAKDLHDGLGGMLSGIKLNLSAMKGNVIIQEHDVLVFNKSLMQLDNAISEMRRIAHNMMPEALLKFGLNEAIHDFCDGINDSRLIKIKFITLGENLPVEQTTKVILYRIVQELCNNAIKHAKAKNIFIQLNHHEQGITLTVEDDGTGMDTTQISNSKGSGLNNVQSRVDYLKGKIEIISEPNNGTSFIIEIPA